MRRNFMARSSQGDSAASDRTPVRRKTPWLRKGVYRGRDDARYQILYRVWAMNTRYGSIPVNPFGGAVDRSGDSGENPARRSWFLRPDLVVGGLAEVPLEALRAWGIRGVII